MDGGSGLRCGAADSSAGAGGPVLPLGPDQVGRLSDPLVEPVYLFEEEFKLHVFGGIYDLPAPDALAFVDGVAEIVLPILLVFGLATRFAALGLLVMTAVIEFIVPEGWANFHLPWAAMAIAIVALGPGPISLDHLISRYVFGDASPRGQA
jgi:putative oxidoreductase